MVSAGIDLAMVRTSKQVMGGGGGVEHSPAFRMYAKEQLLTHALAAYKSRSCFTMHRQKAVPCLRPPSCFENMSSSIPAAVTASELVRCAINAVLEDKDLQMNLVRIDKRKELAKGILDRVIGSEAGRAAFSDF